MIGAIGSSLLFGVQNQVKASGNDPLQPSALELAADNGDLEPATSAFSNPATNEPASSVAEVGSSNNNLSASQDDGTSLSENSSDVFVTDLGAAGRQLREQLGQILDRTI